jgi:hypothetical protein
MPIELGRHGWLHKIGALPDQHRWSSTFGGPAIATKIIGRCCLLEVVATLNSCTHRRRLATANCGTVRGRPPFFLVGAFFCASQFRMVLSATLNLAAGKDLLERQ